MEGILELVADRKVLLQLRSHTVYLKHCKLVGNSRCVKCGDSNRAGEQKDHHLQQVDCCSAAACDYENFRAELTGPT